jgi:MFS superfamily sulfate permease-like transporter
VTGLYVSFFPVIIYAFLGSSRHLSIGKIYLFRYCNKLKTKFVLIIGTFAVSSLMILAAVNSRVGTLIPPGAIIKNETNITTTAYPGEYPSTLGSTILSMTSTMRSSSSSSSTNRYLSNDPDQARIMVGAALALVAGLIHLAMSILHFGYVTVYLSDSIVQGFTTGCAIHIITSQIPPLLGIKIPTINGQSKVIKVKKRIGF